MNYSMSVPRLHQSVTVLYGIPIAPTHLPALLQKSPQRSRRRSLGILTVLDRMPTVLQLLHLSHHTRFVPFLARAWDGAFVGDELVELATDGGRVVVTGDFAFDLFEFDIAVIALVGGGGGTRGGGVGVHVLFVCRALGFVFGGRFGVWGCPIGRGARAAGATSCFGHFDSWVAVGNVEVYLGRSGEG